MNMVSIEEIHLTGLALKSKTSNDKGQSATDCENLWHQFHQYNYQEKITGKLSHEIYGVYFDYEGDRTKPFSYFIGCKVSPGSNVPDGLQSLTIPAGHYQKFTAKGVMPKCVTDVWKKIWTADYVRAYTIDFEIYDERSHDWTKAEVDVYLSMQS